MYLVLLQKYKYHGMFVDYRHKSEGFCIENIVYFIEIDEDDIYFQYKRKWIKLENVENSTKNYAFHWFPIIFKSKLTITHLIRFICFGSAKRYARYECATGS